MSHSLTPPRRRPPQISLGFMLLMMFVFCALSGALYYASQVPEIRGEIGMWLTGEPVVADEGTDARRAQVLFVMFTYTSPLLLAGLLSLIFSLRRRLS
jgi:uncharacterized RDD family membrane protein YckC